MSESNENSNKIKTALTIAGSDPTGGAGMQADLRTFRAMGVHGMGIPSALTAQNTEGVHCVHELTAEFVSEQLDILLQDMTPDALKTGMLYSSDIIELVADRVKKYELKNLVIDPVTISSTGVRLLEEKGLDVLKNSLFPLAEVITPNIYEASLLAGKEIENKKDLKDVAVRLKECGPKAVIITGGHLEGNSEDLLFNGNEFLSVGNERLEGEFHGTGCVFSSVITACLALDHGIDEAFIKAKEFVTNAMNKGITIGSGMRVLDI